MQGIKTIRQAREAVAQEARVLSEALCTRLGPGAGDKGDNGEDEEAFRELREAGPAVRLGRAATPDRERRSEALGRVHHAGDLVPLHRRVDRVGGSELPDCHQRGEEADPEGNHHRRASGFESVV